MEKLRGASILTSQLMLQALPLASSSLSMTYNVSLTQMLLQTFLFHGFFLGCPPDQSSLWSLEPYLLTKGSTLYFVYFISVPFLHFHSTTSVFIQTRMLWNITENFHPSLYISLLSTRAHNSANQWLASIQAIRERLKQILGVDLFIPSFKAI